MPDRPKVIAFDVDADSLSSLRQAFPDWQIEAVSGATAATLKRDWNPSDAELVVVGSRPDLTEVLSLCRGLRSQVGRAHTALLVLVTPGQETQVQATLDAGANGCRVLPVHAKDLARIAAQIRQGNQPGRHTLGLDRAQREDGWRDDGGEG